MAITRLSIAAALAFAAASNGAARAFASLSAADELESSGPFDGAGGCDAGASGAGCKGDEEPDTVELLQRVAPTVLRTTLVQAAAVDVDAPIAFSPSVFSDAFSAAQQADSASSTDESKKATELLSNDTAATPSAADATSTTTLPPTGLTMNAAGDLSAFLSALISNGGACVVFVTAFVFLRRNYPLMYSNNVLIGKAPSTPSDSLFSWLWASLSADIEGISEHAGLDQAMLIEFSHLAMKILLTIGAPMLLIFGPMNLLFGGHAAKADHLSYLSFGNVENDSWLYWVYAFVVWGVALVITFMVYQAQGKFLERRFDWLRSMPHLRANTILVEGIPQEFRSDEKLLTFFEDILPGDGNVERAYVVKDTSELLPMYNELESHQKKLKEAEAVWASHGGGANDRPMMRLSWMGEEVDSIQYFADKVSQLEPIVQAAKARIVELSKQEVGGLNLSTGFVTFSNRVEAEIALRLDGVSRDAEEWRLSTPPAPQDILWEDMTQDENAEYARHVVGHLAIAGLYFAYMPLVLGVTNLAKLINMGPLQPLWQGLVPTMGLTFMVAFLPTFIKLIFELCFTLKASQWAQSRLQASYFSFQVVFVILATAVGQNFRGFTQALVTAPFSIFGVMARTMPYATHFYMNFLVLQWVTHCLNLTRYIQLTKFFIFRRIYDDATAREMSEPEDQDYYGMGSRSARWSTNLAIAIVFGTLSPPIFLLALINFAVTRAVYGYLIPFAESKKTDLGGVFFVMQLRHIFVGVMIYCTLMTAVLFSRCVSPAPAMIAAPSLVYVAWSLKRFDTEFCWENLPFQELMKDVVTATKKRSCDGCYVQPQLADTALASSTLGRSK